MHNDEIRHDVSRRYGAIAKTGGVCCPGSASAGNALNAGYSPAELDTLPPSANLGLGCGNPVALARLQPGQTVLDLGSGGGIDCFLAARRVGPEGHVIGVDMTPEMIARARENAQAGGYANVTFREGFIEALPVEDTSVDVVISNCVVNLSPDKRQVFAEAFRVLKPGGSLFVSDLVLTRRLPWFLRRSMALYAACVAGAWTKSAYLGAIAEAGFEETQLVGETPYTAEAACLDPTLSGWLRLLGWLPRRAADKLAATVASVKVSARKPV